MREFLNAVYALLVPFVVGLAFGLAVSAYCRTSDLQKQMTALKAQIEKGVH